MKFNMKSSQHSRSLADARTEDSSLLERANKERVQLARVPRSLNIAMNKSPSEWQLSSRKLTKELISKVIKSNEAKSYMIQRYIKQMQKLDDSFSLIKNKESSDQVEEIIEVVSRIEEKSKEMVVKNTEVLDTIERVENAMREDQDFIISGLESLSINSEDVKSNKIAARLRAKHLDRNLTM